MSTILSVLVREGLAQLLYTTALPVLSQGRFTNNASNGLVAAAVPGIAANGDALHAAFYAERKYMMKELQRALVAVSKSFDGNAVVLSASHFGNNEYTENYLSIAYAKSLGNISTSLQFRYNRIMVATGGAFNFISYGSNAIIKITPEVNFFVAIYDPHLTKVPKDRIAHASSFSSGIGWQVSSLVYAGMQVSKEQNKQLTIVSTFDYAFSPRCNFSLSWLVTSNEPAVSFKWHMGRLQICAGASYHAALGASPFSAFLYTHKTAEQQE